MKVVEVFGMAFSSLMMSIALVLYGLVAMTKEYQALNSDVLGKITGIKRTFNVLGYKFITTNGQILVWSFLIAIVALVLGIFFAFIYPLFVK